MMLAETYWFFTFLGKFHPMIVHFPIALLILALGMEVFIWIKKQEELRPATYWLVYLGAASALLGMILGWILHLEGYEGALLDKHAIGGYITTGTALLAAGLLYRFTQNQQSGSLQIFRYTLIVSVIALTLTGHFGAELTHGKGYLTEDLPWNQAPGSDDGLSKLVHNTALTSDEQDRRNLEVRAIFAHSCYKCHSEERQKGDLRLDSKEGVFAGGENGEVVVPGNAKVSELIRRIKLSKDHDDVMPFKGKLLSKSEIQIIESWIDQGAHWADEKLKVFREAELALTKPTLPKTNKEFEQEIDRWVDDYFHTKGMRWGKSVDDRTFARRAFLDIVGLLPTTGQLNEFLQDQSPNKREQLVNTLLADQHNYTQHWLSFWNDLLRNDYSGTGFITGGRKQITNWLYSSLLENKPYNQMVQELLNPAPESEGFIKGIRWRGVVNSSQSTEMQAAQNISQSLMGLNLKCASCHDSFVSNLTLEQAYNFASIFADSTLEIHRCDKPTGEFAQAAFLYPKLGKVEAATIKDRLQELSQVIVQPENGRLYRTLVNRIWNKLLGRGLIAPVDEMDRLPWSQDLLDWLAADFVENGYDIKRLIAQIMRSQTYQLASVNYENEVALKSEQFVFQGPGRRRLSAEQFADALSQFVAPAYAGLSYDPFQRKVDAEWIWFREIEVDRNVLPKPGKRWFRHTFDLKLPQSTVVLVANTEDSDPIISAELLISVDHSFRLWLNEEEVATGNDWRKVHKLDVKDVLVNGQNILAIEGGNEGIVKNPAGLLLSLKIRLANGDEIMVNSNQKWLATNEAPTNNWQGLTFEDSSWQKARRYGRFGQAPWGRLIDFYHEAELEGEIEMARASLVQLDPFMKSLGRPTRENVATVRDEATTLLQALMLTNGEFFNELIGRGAKRWQERYENDPESLVQQVYLSALGREATAKELRTAQKNLGERPTKEAIEDLLWAIVLLPEFQLIY